MTTTKLEYIEVIPSTTATGCVIWLHGLGASGNDFVPLAQELQRAYGLSLKFIFPQARLQPVTLNHGYVMPAWYDIHTLEMEQNVDHQGIATSVHDLQTLIAEQVAAGIAASSIVLAGFSQGAVIALNTGLLYSQPLAGLLILSGYFPDAEIALAKAHPANQKTPIFIGHGQHDDVVPFAAAQAMRKILEQHHYPVAWHPYAMPHSLCMEETVDIGLWLKQLFVRG